MCNTQIIVDLIRPIQNLAGSMISIHYVAPTYLIGGLLIIFGFLTRWSIVVQLPIIIGPIMINFVGEMDTNNLILSSIVFLLYLFFQIYGSGKHSADYYFKMQQ